MKRNGEFTRIKHFRVCSEMKRNGECTRVVCLWACSDMKRNGEYQDPLFVGLAVK
jgi:hypothetical protein